MRGLADSARRHGGARARAGETVDGNEREKRPKERPTRFPQRRNGRPATGRGRGLVSDRSTTVADLTRLTGRNGGGRRHGNISSCWKGANARSTAPPLTATTHRRVPSVSSVDLEEWLPIGRLEACGPTRICRLSPNVPSVTIFARMVHSRIMGNRGHQPAGRHRDRRQIRRPVCLCPKRSHAGRRFEDASKSAASHT